MSKNASKPSDDKIKLELGPKGGSLEVIGHAAGRLTHQLADLLSPLTEGVGLVGDQIRLFRQRAVVAALERAHEIARERGTKLKSIPPKFLVEWMESASLENEEEVELRDWWAKLLVSASEDYKSAHIAYVDLLKKLDPEDAKTIRFLAHDTRDFLRTTRARSFRRTSMN